MWSCWTSVASRAGSTSSRSPPAMRMPRPMRSSATAMRCGPRPAAGAEIIGGATVWGGFAPDEIGALLGEAAATFRPRRLILRPRRA